MNETVRPISRIAAVELTDLELDDVVGGLGTDVYCRPSPQQGFHYDYSHPD